MCAGNIEGGTDSCQVRKIKKLWNVLENDIALYRALLFATVSVLITFYFIGASLLNNSVSRKEIYNLVLVIETLFKFN